MPAYDFQCTKCLHAFEVSCSVDERNNVTYCPQCGFNAERTYSGQVGFQFKGTGFYETDYKKKS